jgi:hypothetical protein
MTDLELLARRKKRYAEDEEYRERLLAGNRARHHRNKDKINARPHSLSSSRSIDALPSSAGSALQLTAGAPASGDRHFRKLRMLSAISRACVSSAK